ncbi:alanine racemase [Thermovenabulum gondwanense]|uniref:Alanine racemase n=1 Tax=Thermovenabulum gondwanense TaxID=520767 RepID=A0A162MP00_9FIRM|nr:alanine racemase [Thermovenabulum gondwanense]KYO66833.1 Alanine racemase [Thermovenabulum gondwanense]
MQGFLRPTRAEILLDNLKHNINEVLRVKNKNSKFCAVVKADAYGHGALEVSRVALSMGAEYLAVAFLDEALALRREGVRAPILILGFTPEDQFDKIIENDITQTVFSLEMAERLSLKAIKMGKPVKIHIKLDTGMGRIGFLADSPIISEVERVFELPGIEVEGIFTHFARADEKDKDFTFEQFYKFMDVVGRLESKGYRIPIKHAANSAAIIDLPETHLDMVRAGIMLYGCYPSDEVDKEKVKLKPVMSFKTKIAHLKELEKGKPISYGGTFITQRNSRIATLPVGYADGYFRLLSSKGEVFVKGKRAKVVGRVCMDQCMVDVTEIEGLKVADDVELFGDGTNNGVTADEVAKIIGTISYEVLCAVSKRVPRVYIEDGKIIKVKNYLTS